MSKFRTHLGVILAMALALSPIGLYAANAANASAETPKDDGVEDAEIIDESK